MKAGAVNAIDAIMERASRALAETRYFDAARLCTKALLQARHADDFGRMARICLPLQEARRWIRQEALDTGEVTPVASAGDLRSPPTPGCYLVQPPLIGLDARQFRDQAWTRGLAIFVLCREPMTRDGHWPLVAVGERVTRVRIDPPPGVEPADASGTSPRPVTGDRITAPLTTEWFASAAEALGDGAIADASAAGNPGDPPAWIVDDHLDLIEACPDHEMFMQALAAACRNAIGTTTPADRRRRRGSDHPGGF